MANDTSSRKKLFSLRASGPGTPNGEGSAAGPTSGPASGKAPGPCGEPLAGRAVGCDLRILMALRRIMHYVDTHSRKLSMDQHITLPQLICLHTIVHDGPMTLSALGRLVSLSTSTINGIVDRLEAKGLVERNRSDPDRRKVLVSTTEAGTALAHEVPLPLQDRLLQAVSALPDLEQVSITLSLERIVDMMEAGHPEARRK